jgi:hypothetical protein
MKQSKLPSIRLSLDSLFHFRHLIPSPFSFYFYFLFLYFSYFFLFFISFVYKYYAFSLPFLHLVVPSPSGAVLSQSSTELRDFFLPSPPPSCYINPIGWRITLRPITVHTIILITPHPTGSGILLGLFDPWIYDRVVIPKRRYEIAILRCVKSQKSAGLIYRTAEA